MARNGSTRSPPLNSCGSGRQRGLATTCMYRWCSAGSGHWNRPRVGSWRVRRGDLAAVGGRAAAAAAGDATAWEQLVDRYAGLVWSVCLRYRLADADADADDVSQAVWLRTVEQLDRLGDAEALPGWLITPPAVLRTGRRTVGLGVNVRVLEPTVVDVAEGVLEADRASALEAGLAGLPPQRQRLLALLVTDPPPSSTEVGTRLGVPVDSIGPTRARCLDKLRRSPAMALTADRAGR